ncbi:preprotein translocase subunit YajC [Mycobacterium sp. 141]|uniref:preprotein translocase subunit YajC n=1 Tax=Mycobacterium sp. 141 TaxID=1120797 RepID=UPI000378DB97|nr:preprotein translocase subunit YajC [Mycobacterium sp. 141]
MDIAIFIPLLIIMGGFMFYTSRRQKRAMQKTIDLHNSLQIGDRVHTTSGLQATITRITDDNVDLEIAPGVITTWMKLAVRDRIEDGAGAAKGKAAPEVPTATELTESTAVTDSDGRTKD